MIHSKNNGYNKRAAAVFSHLPPAAAASNFLSIFSYRMLLLLATVALLSQGVPIAYGAAITGVTVSDVVGELNSGNLAVNTVNGSGLSAYPPTPGVTSHSAQYNIHWTSPEFGQIPVSVSDAFIEWDLNSLYRLDSIQVWNYNLNADVGVDVTNRSIRQVDIYISSLTAGDPGDPEIPGTGNGDNWTLLFGGDSILPQAPGLDSYPGFDLATQLGTALPPAPVRFVRFEIDTTYGGDSYGSFAGLSEIAFSGTGASVDPVPEPATMLLLGSGLMGMAGLGRKKFRK